MKHILLNNLQSKTQSGTEMSPFYVILQTKIKNFTEKIWLH